MSIKLLSVLLVEDNPPDVELTRCAFEFGNIPHTLYVAENGEEALDFLYRREQFSQAPKPDLILLDLNLPKVHGKDVLRTVKNDNLLKDIPVVIVSGSDAASDHADTQRLKASGYVVKPLDVEKLQSIIKTMENL